MLCPVGLHQLLHLLEKRVPVFHRIHIDEIDNYDASHIPESELSCNFFGSIAVHVKGVLLLFLVLASCPAVDINHVEGFCVFNHQIGSLLDWNYFPERTLDLPGNLEMVEDRSLVLVEFDNLFLLRRNEADVFAYFIVDFFIVDVDVRKRIIQQIPEDGSRLAVFGKQQLDAFGLGNFNERTFPFVDERHQFRVQNCGILAFCSGADDCSVIFGKYALYECFKSFLFLLGGNLLGYAHLFCKREQYNVSSCQ